MNEPLLLSPMLAERVWGGERLGDGMGEAWDLSVHAHGLSRIAAGAHKGKTLAELAAAHPESFGGPIDLLAKRLDCGETLSVQVHPKTGEPKTECWVVLDGEPGAGVYHGFDRPCSREEVERAIANQTLTDLLRFVPVKRGDVIFVPSGTVHAIGAGLYLFELQQSSDTTYRLYDWGRGRQLHIEEGLACADLDAGDLAPPVRALGSGRTALVECPHFYVDRLQADDEIDIDPGTRWAALFVVTGTASAGGVEAAENGTLLLPTAGGARRVRCDRAELLVYGPSRSSA